LAELRGRSAQEYIEIRGARENNLKGVSLRIPKRQITVFTGVSGSGKSSLVFDTIATEAQRQLNENFSTFIRGFLPKYPQPNADAIENLSTAIVVDQKRLGGGSHSTVGTVTDISGVLRMMFSRIGTPQIGPANLFSFNDSQGMCPDCNGMGVDLARFVDMSKSLREGALLYGDYAPDSWGYNILASSGFFDLDRKLSDYTEEQLKQLLHGAPSKVAVTANGKAVNFTFEGIIDKFVNKYIKRDLKSYSERTQKQVEPYLTLGPCDTCRGARLSQKALNVRVGGYNIAELSAMEIDELLPVIQGLGESVGKEAEPIVATLAERLGHLVDIGLEYLSLNRETDSLSGGESARVKMVKNLSSSLMDLLYIFDEPSVGLHPRDVHRLNELLVKLRDKGNTVLVVEHDPDVIKGADHVVDMGPRAGRDGGRIVFEGNYTELLKTDTLTGRHLGQPLPIKAEFRAPRGSLPIVHASENNLRDVSVGIPQGVLTVITGVAGSGKSTLIHRAFLQQHTGAIVIDQSPVGANSRSNPATYTGILDPIRKAFAVANGVQPALFSFNSKGACDNCQGLGVVYTDLAFLDEVKLPCEVCGGKRFKEEVLAYRLEGRSISDVLEMNVEQALEFFSLKDVRPVLESLRAVGLGYMTLGPPLSTLSGGECQRIKIAGELHRKGNLYVLDEPTTGLHMSDITHLLAILNHLVDAGNTVVVIEHNLYVIRNADWIIDMGPEGGNKGGRVMFEGTPRQLAGAPGSLTSRYLSSSGTRSGKEPTDP
jgi:excinuclease UvrABC ATPase subunit